MEEKKETFTYRYSAGQQAEIKKIREKYMPQEPNKMERLRRLDESATRPGRIAALLIGLVSTLLFGFGLCCCLLWMDRLLYSGVIIGCIGIAGMAVAYPVYSYLTRKRRKKLAPEIIRLTDELLK